MAANEVEIAVLRIACDRIFKFIIEDLNISSVDLNHDLYWTLTNEDRFNMQRTPIAENVGNLIDDYEFVRPAAIDADQALPLLFEHLAPILAALATKVPNFR